MATNRATRYPGRWGAVSADYPMGVPKNRTSDTAKDGSYFEKDWIADYEAYFGAVLDEAGETVDGTTDTAQSSQLHKAMQKAREVSPLNNDWNGYLDPDHQSSLPAPNGYPGASGGGEAPYTADQEISSGIFAGSGGATVASDSDGWIFTGSIYKLFDYTTEQLADIDVTKVPVYLKDQAGVEYFLKHNGTSVIVTKVGSQLKVEITAAIFTVSFTKLWRFFVTERVGRVVELSVDAVNKLLTSSSEATVIAELLTGWGGGATVGFVDVSDKREIIFGYKIETSGGGAEGYKEVSVSIPNYLNESLIGLDSVTANATQSETANIWLDQCTATSVRVRTINSTWSSSLIRVMVR